VQLQLVTAAVKLFLKRPQPRAQQMIQLVLTYATQVRNFQAQLY
jgi:AP-1 complex subunit beta-1